ncbi:amino acid permease [Acetobacter musti]|uniref:Amino acid permease n=1 Tax=Acetobacter musti TaxID=864732 RepID=A0ABX0JMA9_9PROT|nr:amino acid permease [Acetobacter musti]NHN84533.1 amino acid permease [Acetobacter musti]
MQDGMNAQDTPGAAHPDGYHKGLGRRQIQMIAIGGAIGTGLFLGAGARLQSGGPSLALVYLVCGFFAFLILRALGELIMHRPTSGSFVDYAEEFLGEKTAFVAGWMAFLNWSMTGIADITAVAMYMHFWAPFGGVPQWVFALIALCIVTSMNLIGVKYFGEMEFWFSLIKIIALVIFLITGTVILGTRMPLDGHTTGLHLISDNGGMFPHGLLAALALTQGVVFAYSGIELIGTAAGECADAKTVVPRAINSVIWRIALFYVGSVVLMVCLLPWTAYHAGVSPFVTFFQALGVPYADTAMNVVVLTAALSSLNSGLYSTSRVLRALALGGSAPRVLTHMNKNAVPSAAIMLMVTIYLIGVVLNYIVPKEVFEIVLSFAAVGVIGQWAIILLCQIAFRRAVGRGRYPSPAFPMPAAPVSAWASLGFLIVVIVLMAWDYPAGTYTVAAIPLIGLILVVGWYLAPKKPPMHMPETVPSVELTRRVLEGGD